MVGFASSDTSEGRKAVAQRFSKTGVWPVQKYSWKDLFAKRGGTYWYEIVPMIGTPKDLKPDATKAMRTNSVTVDSHHGDCSVFFNRGINLLGVCGLCSGMPNSDALKKAIQKPGNALRSRLVGNLEDGVLTLLERAQKEGGQCYCALYELSDKDLVDHLAGLGKRVHIVLSNAGEDTEEGAGDGDLTNTDARKRFHKLKMDVTDRMLKKGHIGHNKFVVYVDKTGVPQAVLIGQHQLDADSGCARRATTPSSSNRRTWRRSTSITGSSSRRTPKPPAAASAPTLQGTTVPRRQQARTRPTGRIWSARREEAERQSARLVFAQYAAEERYQEQRQDAADAGRPRRGLRADRGRPSQGALFLALHRPAIPAS